MLLFSSIQPDHVYLETIQGRTAMKKDTSTLKWRNHSTCVEFSEKGEQMEVRLQSPHAKYSMLSFDGRLNGRNK